MAVRYESYEKTLKASGHSVRVLSPNRRSVDSWVIGDGPVCQAMKGFPLIACTFDTVRRLLDCFQWCDVVISPETEQAMTLALLSTIYRKPWVVNIHTNVHQQLATKPITRIFAGALYYGFVRTALLCPLAKCYTVSDANKKSLESNNVTVSGVYELQTRKLDPLTAEHKDALRNRMAPGISTSTPIILFAGRWLAEKRIDRLIDTLPSNAALVIIGDGPLPLQELHDPSKRIFVHKGFVPHSEIYPLFAAASFVANASDFETFGNCSYEGNSCGTPCILHPAGGHLSQIKEQGTNGYFVDFDRDDEVVREDIRHIVSLPPKSSEDVIAAMVRRPGAVTIHDVIQREPVKLTRFQKYRKVVTFPVRFLLLLLAFSINLSIVLSTVLLGGRVFVAADTMEERRRRILKRRRKRDMIREAARRGLTAVRRVVDPKGFATQREVEMRVGRQQARGVDAQSRTTNGSPTAHSPSPARSPGRIGRH